MPQANPNRSFEIASRHLFRHINDITALRLNPLVNTLIDRFEPRPDGNAGLPELHSRILKIARDAVRKNANNSTKARAQREEQIVTALCRGERWQTTARRLRLSERQYYRERRAIRERVSQELLKELGSESAHVRMNDALLFLLAQAAALADQGFPLKAASVLQDAMSSLPEGGARCVVNSALARTLLSCDLPSRASELMNECSAKVAELHNNDDPSGWVRDHVLHTKALVAREKGDHDIVAAAFETLAKRRNAEQRADEESVTAAYESGVWYGVIGRFDKARTMLAQARQLNRRLAHRVPRLEISLMLLAARCADDPDFELSLQYKWLSEARVYSIATGSAQGAVDAIGGLLYYHASTGKNEAIYSLSEEGLQIAKATESILLLQIVSNQIIQSVLKTPRWRAVDPLIFDIANYVELGSFQWAMLRRLQGIFYRRTGQLEAATIALKDALSFLQAAGDKGLMALILRQLALVQKQAGAMTESFDSIRQAVHLAEGNSNASALCATYEAAAEILKERRFSRLARQARAALVTRNTHLPSADEPASARPTFKLTLDHCKVTPRANTHLLASS